MEESKIFIANYPNPLQRPSFVDENDRSKTLEVLCGYDTQINSHEVTLQIARDLITALLTFDRIYIQGNNVWDVMQVWGSTYVKELLRLHILCIIPDQELNPAMLNDGRNSWKCDFFSYPIGNSLDYNPDKIDRWTHIEFCFNKHGFKGIEANAILYLIDENSANINSKNFQSKVNSETDMDSKSPTFLSDSNFYRKRSDGIWEYNLISRIRLQELNKNVILATELGIDNIKMDGEINNLMLKKTVSAFSKDIHCGSDALVRIEQQKGFPDLGELFVNKILDLDDILKLRENWNGKLFRYWAKLTDYEENLMRKDVLNSVNNIIGSKLLQPLRLLGTNLIGIAGFLPGIVASTFDSYVLDNVLKGWHPNFFLDNKLKALIDDCVKRDNDKRKVKLLSERFKGVRPNDPCPCGSGKKFKKCHAHLL